MGTLVRAMALIGVGLVAAMLHSWASPLMVRVPEPPRVIVVREAPESGERRTTTDPAADPTRHVEAEPDLPERFFPDAMGSQLSLAETRFLHDLIDSGEVVFLDARAYPGRYEEGHILGALHVTSSMIDSGTGAIDGMNVIDYLVAFFPPTTRFVVYCDGGECDESENLRIRLYELGYHVSHVFKDGYRAWAEAGLPIATGHDPYGE